VILFQYQSSWKIAIGGLVGLRLERFDPEYSPLIPDPMESKFSYALELVNWIWDQSLLTVEINTIT
jgi:hypothetical protein